MTPETYMRRYHTDCGCAAQDAPTLPAEVLFPNCPQAEQDTDCCCGHTPAPTPPVCCCKASMVEALNLLCNQDIASLVDFDSFFFLTDALTVGGPLTVPATGAPDNISALNASFQRFSPCNCDLIDVSGTAYFATPGAAGTALETVDQISLCALKAVAFGLTDLNCPVEDCQDQPYRRILRALRRAIRAEGGSTGACGVCASHCDCDTCCCDTGVLTELASRNLSRQASLTAGSLVLQNVTVLGSIGSVLVLADESQERIYFVCVSNVEVLG